MTIFKEDTVRQLYFRQGITELHLKADDYITEQARAYLHEKGIPLHRESPLTSPAPYTPNPDIHPPEGTGASPASFVGPDGEHYSSKPEHMTHLYGNCLVPKNHPRIILRGKLDSLEAAILWAQATAQREG